MAGVKNATTGERFLLLLLFLCNMLDFSSYFFSIFFCSFFQIVQLHFHFFFSIYLIFSWKELILELNAKVLVHVFFFKLWVFFKIFFFFSSSPVLLILLCCPLVFTSIALIKSSILHPFFLNFCHNCATLLLEDIHKINKTINRFVYCWPASIERNISSLLMRN